MDFLSMRYFFTLGPYGLRIALLTVSLWLSADRLSSGASFSHSWPLAQFPHNLTPHFWHLIDAGKLHLQ